MSRVWRPTPNPPTRGPPHDVDVKAMLKIAEAERDRDRAVFNEQYSRECSERIIEEERAARQLQNSQNETKLAKSETKLAKSEGEKKFAEAKLHAQTERAMRMEAERDAVKAQLAASEAIRKADRAKRDYELMMAPVFIRPANRPQAGREGTSPPQARENPLDPDLKTPPPQRVTALQRNHPSALRRPPRVATASNAGRPPRLMTLPNIPPPPRVPTGIPPRVSTGPNMSTGPNVSTGPNIPPHMSTAPSIPHHRVFPVHNAAFAGRPASNPTRLTVQPLVQPLVVKKKKKKEEGDDDWVPGAATVQPLRVTTTSKKRAKRGSSAKTKKARQLKLRKAVGDYVDGMQPNETVHSKDLVACLSDVVNPPPTCRSIGNILGNMVRKRKLDSEKMKKFGTKRFRRL